jgi:hypothetical protein
MVTILAIFKFSQKPQLQTKPYVLLIQHRISKSKIGEFSVVSSYILHFLLSRIIPAKI